MKFQRRAHRNGDLHMRILILGGDGMLGHQLFAQLRQNHEVRVTVRGAVEQYAEFGLFDDSNTIDQIDLSSTASLNKAMEFFQPQVVVNAVGIVKQRDSSSDKLLSLEINSVLPHRLASLCRNFGARLIHFSTDCVFRGDRGWYTEADVSDAMDVYGRTKFLGEVDEAHCVTLRTSIIGLELHRKRSLIEWFLRQEGKVTGYTNAIFTGVTTMEIARFVEHIVCRRPKMSGLYHVASARISKYELLSKLAAELKKSDTTIVADPTFECDRSLVNGRLIADADYSPPPWDQMLGELASLIKSRHEV